MPRFFFDFDDGDRRIIDAEGRWFATRDDAISAATAAFRHVGDGERTKLARRRYRMVVRDEHGGIVSEANLTGRDARTH